MAWTSSAPQRRSVAAILALSTSPRLLQRTMLMLGRGDPAKGACIGFAAFLSALGFAVPQLSAESVAAVLFITGTLLIGFATFAPAPSVDDVLIDAEELPAPQTARRAAQICLDELLATTTPQTLSDRTAFARLTAHMSHELRTPLNAILGFSEMMSNEVFGPLGSSSYTAYARDIHASGISLLKSAEDALAITTLLTATDASERLRIAHAATVCSEALAFHAHDFKRRALSVSCTVDADADIAGEPHAVRQLLINLIAEAAQRADVGAHLAIASRTDTCDIELQVTVSAPLKAARLEDSFSVLLARTLGELVGAHVTIDGDAADGETWQAAARFPRVAQPDFFGARTAH